MSKVILPAHDLFPETLLVSVAQGHIFTDSLKIAEHFGKKHLHVLRSISKLMNELGQSNFGLSSDFAQLNFEPSTYLNKQNKPQPMYHLSRDGFALLAMGFTGQKALYWKVQFINAFNEMESQLHAQEQRYLTALDTIRPNLRPVVEGTQQGLVRNHIANAIGKTPAAVTYHRRVAKRLGLLAA